jgi:hypothetical protein
MFPALWHRYIFLFGIIGLASGMLFGTVPTSIPQIILAANWLLEKNFSEKIRQLKTNKVFLTMLVLYLLHLVGMFYTENTQQGLNDLRNKLPLLTLPIILFSTKPLTKNEFRLLLHFFFLSVLVSSVCCYLVFAGFTPKTIIDVRNASVFMSHIRFSLFIAFAITGLSYYLINETQNTIRIVYLLTAFWLLYFMYKLEMATGFLCLIITAGILLFTISFKRLNKPVAIGFGLALLFSLILAINWRVSSLKMFEPITSNKANRIIEKNKNDYPYYHDTVSKISENGNLIFININVIELEREWNKRSDLKFSELDKKGNPLQFTALRYMASKGLTKDSTGIAALSPTDITAIQNGNTNYKYNINSGLISKWRGLVWEYAKYKRGENPSGHTLMMRLEFWKNATYIIYTNPVIGVGTGDIQKSYDLMYIQTKSKLDPVWRLRCHNQYLAITVAFGFIGLILFLFYLFYPPILLRKNLHYLYWPFFIIALLSFITEDTLETQAGVSFFIFFQTLFLWLASHPHKTDLINKN